MRYYEMLFIVHPNYEQDRLDAVIDTVQKEIAGKGGKILKTDNWGKRKLAYLINKQRYGSYVLMYFEADPSLIQGLYEWMEIQSQILHQMVIRLEEKPELSETSENPDTAYSKPEGKRGYSKDAPKAEAKAAPVKEEAKEEVKEEVVEEKAEEETKVEAEVEAEVEEEAKPEEVVEADKEGE